MYKEPERCSFIWFSDDIRAYFVNVPTQIKYIENMTKYKKPSKVFSIDEIDKKILDILQNAGRISLLKLSTLIQLSQPAIHHRVKQLEQKGYIKKYVAIINHEKLGFKGWCFISISLHIHQLELLNQFKQQICRMPEVLECHHVTGEFDYLLKVLITDNRELQHFIFSKIRPIPGVDRVFSSMILNKIKCSTKIPVS